jgi:hypothetical protein
MLVSGWIALQSSYGQSVNADDARSMARDALERMRREVRDAQPPSLTTSGQAIFTVAGPMEVDFYSAFNVVGASSDGVGTGALLLTRLYLDTSGSSPQKTLWLQRDSNKNGIWDAGDRKILLARDVVNGSVADASTTPATSYTAMFMYDYRDGSGDLLTADTIPTSDLGEIVAVRIRILVDNNLNHTPAPVDYESTVHPRNASQS